MQVHCGKCFANSVLVLVRPKWRSIGNRPQQTMCALFFTSSTLGQMDLFLDTWLEHMVEFGEENRCWFTRKWKENGWNSQVVLGLGIFLMRKLCFVVSTPVPTCDLFPA